MSFRLQPSSLGTKRKSRRRGFDRRCWTWLLVFTAFAVFHDTLHFAGADEAAPVETAETVDSPSSDPETAGHDSEHSDAEPAGHSDPVAPLLIAITTILFLAKLSGDIFERLGMPAVLGELFVGIILGNFALLTGSEVFEYLKAPPSSELPHVLHKIEKQGPASLNQHDRDLLAQTNQELDELEAVLDKSRNQNADPLTEEELHILEVAVQRSPYHAGSILKMLASIGVILLLFEVGLESTVREMMSVGVSSMFVAILGVVVPMFLGWGVGWLLVRDLGWQVHVFIGATLCATSVGITARVLKDLGRSQQRESQIILGAAVIDDVLGLVVLAVVSGVIQQGEISAGTLLIVVGKAFGFLIGALLLGNLIFTRPLFKSASFLYGHGLLVAASLVICFGFSWLANFFGLAPIVGAFAAGLILERTHYRELGDKEQHSLEDALAPLSALLVPIFFVQMGIQVDVSAFLDTSVLLLAGAITVVAIIGKQVCSLGVREPGLNKIAVGLGMIPRGEVGLIFADVGRGLKVAGKPVIDDATFSAVVVMVMITTMVTPPLLKWSMTQDEAEPSDGQTEEPTEE